jgi:hypothetical protein
LGSLARLPLEAWMSVCFYSVFVLFCDQIAALRQTDPPSKASYRLCKKIKRLKKRPGRTKDCRVVDRKTAFPYISFTWETNEWNSVNLVTGVHVKSRGKFNFNQCWYSVTPRLNKDQIKFYHFLNNEGPIKWPCSRRNEIFLLARTLGSLVRIPLEVWMYVRVISVFVLYCVGSGLATGWAKKPYVTVSKIYISD